MDACAILDALEHTSACSILPHTPFFHRIQTTSYLHSTFLTHIRQHANLHLATILKTIENHTPWFCCYKYKTKRQTKALTIFDTCGIVIIIHHHTRIQRHFDNTVLHFPPILITKRYPKNKKSKKKKKKKTISSNANHIGGTFTGSTSDYGKT